MTYPYPISSDYGPRDRGDGFHDGFWERVAQGDTESCWLWRGGKNALGYGGYYWQGKLLRASRVAWMLTYGSIPKGMHVCHTCDNPPCVNPQHLFLGTPRDNMRDAVRKGRNQAPPIHRGEAGATSKLSDAAVVEIRRLRGDGFLLRELAERFNCSISQVHNIVHRVQRI